jgi:hypothetical protein
MSRMSGTTLFTHKVVPTRESEKVWWIQLREESIECAIYPVTPCIKCSASNVISRLAHVTNSGAKHSIFIGTMKNRGIFREFYARIFINARFILWSASFQLKSRSLYSRPRPHPAIWIEHSHWSIFEFQERDSPKTSYMEHIVYSAFDTLFPSLLFTLGARHFTN